MLWCGLFNTDHFIELGINYETFSYRRNTRNHSIRNAALFTGSSLFTSGSNNSDLHGGGMGRHQYCTVKYSADAGTYAT